MQKLKLTKCWKALMLLVCGSLLSAGLYAQSTIKGTVTSDKGEPLAGATVRLKSTPIGAVTTDVNGKFSIKLAAGETALQVTYLGYVTQEVAVTSKTSNLTIALVSSSKDLNEVVVVGYGTLRKQDVTGTVATVDNKSLQEIPSANVFEQMKGKVAGLDVVESASSGPAITIRGNRTIGQPSADAPLIVLDGEPFYNFIENIDPNNIKSVDILKGASATAIYGSRGSGGVILITTFRGRVGQTITSYDTYYGISRLEGGLNTLNGQQ